VLAAQQELTLAQRAFWLVGLFFVPALAPLGYLHANGWARFGKAAALSSLGAAGLGFGGLTAVLLYPAYPARGPHELVATAFVLPALIFPFLATLAPPSVALNRRELPLVGVFGVAAVGCAFFFARGAEISLPLTVQDVQRFSESDLQDYSRYSLLAQGIERFEAERYALSLGLVPSHDPAPCTPPPEFSAERNTSRPAVWSRDDRRREDDMVSYPSGFSGCVESVVWVPKKLFYCNDCDWGI
jgi:hypothetical protein